MELGCSAPVPASLNPVLGGCFWPLTAAPQEASQGAGQVRVLVDLGPCVECPR